eukprot:1013778-Prorocentrum_minimum.AAC.1
MTASKWVARGFEVDGKGRADEHHNGAADGVERAPRGFEVDGKGFKVDSKGVKVDGMGEC